MSFGRRSGTFSLVTGIFLLLYYIFSVSVEPTSVSFLLGGFALIGFGILLLITHPAPPAQNGRFRVLHRKKGK
jgi:hypothetical protein